jgi:hypothetical protein
MTARPRRIEYVDLDTIVEDPANGIPTGIYMPVFLAALGDESIAAVARLGKVR